MRRAAEPTPGRCLGLRSCSCQSWGGTHTRGSCYRRHLRKQAGNARSDPDRCNRSRPRARSRPAPGNPQASKPALTVRGIRSPRSPGCYWKSRRTSRSRCNPPRNRPSQAACRWRLCNQSEKASGIARGGQQTELTGAQREEHVADPVRCVIRAIGRTNDVRRDSERSAFGAAWIGVDHPAERVRIAEARVVQITRRIEAARGPRDLNVTPREWRSVLAKASAN